MRKGIKVAIIAVLAVTSILVGIIVGSANISISEIVEIVRLNIFGGTTTIPATTAGIIWQMRIPRVLLAFVVGALLSMTGAVMQSLLQNPLASAYTLGVSSGAAFGVSLFVFADIVPKAAGIFGLPLVGLCSGMIVVVLIVTLSSKIDKRMGNHTIILLGMVFSLFVNAMLTLITSLSRQTLEQMINWQMGSFAFKNWSFLIALMPIAVVGTVILMLHSRELDNLTFGEDAAATVGINVKRTKWVLLFAAAALTGCAVALVGVIGFVDLVVPHITRKIFGPSHKIVIPMSALLGGSFLVFSDIIARTIVTPSELPIGAVTAIVGAPFFIYIYFKGRAK